MRWWAVVLEFVRSVGAAVRQTRVRVARVVLEWVLVFGTWLALLLIDLAMSRQRGGLPWFDPSDARSTSRSPDR